MPDPETLPSPTPRKLGHVWPLERINLALSAQPTALNSFVEGKVSRMEPEARRQLLLWYNLKVTAVAVLSAYFSTLTMWRFASQFLSSCRAGGGKWRKGITTSWWYLPFSITILLLLQAIRKGAQARAAALNSISTSSFLLSLRGIFPSTSFAFPSPLADLPRRSRVRIAAAGVFNILVVYSFIIALAAHRSLNTPRAITEVSPGAGLDSHLLVGDIITHVNGVEPGNLDWKSVVSARDNKDPGGKGWCIPLAWADEAPSAPCADKQLVSFVLVDSLHDPLGSCLPPHKIINSPIRSCWCSADNVCVRPAPNERIVRLRYVRDGNERIFLWKGEKYVLLALRITPPRDGLIHWAAILLWHFYSVCHVFAITTLLPVARTDSARLFSALGEPDSIVVEGGDGIAGGSDVPCLPPSWEKYVAQAARVVSVAVPIGLGLVSAEAVILLLLPSPR